MIALATLIDPDDGLPATEVGSWSIEKHKYLSTYVDISRAVRKKFLHGPSKTATFIDLFCGSGRSRIKETNAWIDGSAINAWKMSVKGGAPFSKIYIADLDKDLRSANAARLKKLNAPVEEIDGSAIEAAKKLKGAVNPHGLHCAFLDPFSLGALDFEIIKALSSLKRIDMLIHLSVMDLQRNFPMNLSAEASAFEAFAPGWKSRVDPARPDQQKRVQFIEYWRELVSNIGVWSSRDNVKLITGEKNQRLYWLILAAKSDIALEFWKEALKMDSQGSLF